MYCTSPARPWFVCVVRVLFLGHMHLFLTFNKITENPAGHGRHSSRHWHYFSRSGTKLSSIAGTELSSAAMMFF